MTAVLVDSSAFLSLEDPDERSHDRLRATVEELVGLRTRLLTTNFVFDETYTLILTRLGRHRAVAWGERVRESRLIERVRVGQDDEERAWDIIRSFADKAFSYTDATSFAVAEKLAIERALTLDRHFVEYGRLEVLPAGAA